MTLDEYLMGRDSKYILGDDLKANAINTVIACNHLLTRFGEQRTVNSGWRPIAINSATVGASATSKHITCQACDIHDPNGDLDEWCKDNLDVLAEIGLWLESPAHTPGWCHVQTVPPRSGNRIFIP